MMGSNDTPDDSADELEQSTDSAKASGDLSVDEPKEKSKGAATSEDLEAADNVVVLYPDRMPKVLGQTVEELPKDLYIPPDALEVFLETFEGPLDLLLYLIRKQNLDILDIPVAQITTQYMEYVEMMRQLRLDLAAEYLVMAATLAEIKSRMLLPREPSEDDEDGQDPRAILVKRLQEYERFRSAAMTIDERPRLERDIFVAYAPFEDKDPVVAQPEVSLDDLVKAFRNVVELAAQRQHFVVGKEVMSVRDRMMKIIAQLQGNTTVRFEDMFDFSEGRMGLVVTFSAILELSRDRIVTIMQPEPFAPITVKQAADSTRTAPTDFDDYVSELDGESV